MSEGMLYRDDQVVCREKDIIHSNLGDEAVMMSIEKGAYYGLNSVGRRIWEIVEEPTRISSILAMLQNEFNVSNQECQRATNRFLREMVGLGLIDVQE